MIRVLLIVTAVFVLLSGFLFWQVRSLSESKAELEITNKTLSENAIEWDRKFTEQKERAEKLDQLLSDREKQQKKNAVERQRLYSEIERLKNENQNAADYLDTSIPVDVIRLLVPADTNSPIH